jgi:hypothetical protein
MPPLAPGNPISTVKKSRMESGLAELTKKFIAFAENSPD